MKRSVLESLEQFFWQNPDKSFKGDFLCKRYDIKSQELREIVHRLRVNKVPVLSDNQGYYLSTNKEKIMSGYLSLRGRALSIAEAANGLYHYLEENN